MSRVRWLRPGALAFALGCLLLTARDPSLSAQEPELLSVTSIDGQGAALYAEPNPAAEVIAWLPDGGLLWVAGPDVQAEDAIWRHVQDAEGQSGYLTSDLVVAVASPPATEAPPPLAAEPPPQDDPIATDPAPRSSPQRRNESTDRRTSQAVARARSTPTPTSTANQAEVAARSSSRATVTSASTGARRVDESETASASGELPDRHPKLDSQLAAAARAHRERGATAAADEARQRNLKVVDNRVRVVIESVQGDRSGARAAVAGAGGQTEAEHANLVQALLPVSELEAVAARADVRYVRPPFASQLDAVAGEGVGTTAANFWHNAGMTGTGVKVAVIDGGFAGLAARQASGDLPFSLTTQDFCGGQFSTATNHGTAVAEIVHEIAPGAQLFLICTDTEVQLGQAKDYAKSQGIHVINHSVSWFNTSRGDGTGAPGTPDAIVADARASGILWVNSSGNRARLHWSGNFADNDGDGIHNFTPTDEGNTVFLAVGASICAFLKWDDWPTSAQDFNLFLNRSSNNTTVALSANVQNGSQRPTEALCYINTTGVAQNFYLAIRRFLASGTPRFDLFFAGESSEPQYVTVAGSVTEPGSSPNTMSAGAICWQNDALETFSSQGPTIDNRTKPDIAGQDGVSSGTYGNFSTCGTSGFSGTSASSPHAAGAAALVKQANPGFSPAQLQSFLEGRAVDLGPTGKDNSFGSGKLALGQAPFSCPSGPRPSVGVAVVPSGSGRVQVTVTAGVGSLLELRFGTPRASENALVDIGNQTDLAGAFTITPPANTQQSTFFVRRQNPGVATAHFTARDACGDWPAFAGLGQNVP